MAKKYIVTDWNLLIDRMITEIEFMDKRDLFRLAKHMKVDMGDILEEFVDMGDILKEVDI